MAQETTNSLQPVEKRRKKLKGKHFFLLLLLPFGTGRRLRFRLAVTHTHPIFFPSRLQ
jgi:hypothetical protein